MKRITLILTTLFLVYGCLLSQSFTKATTEEIENDNSISEGCAWGDYDNDGYEDLFIAVMASNNLLYKNNGDGSFTKITEGDIVNDGGASLSATWGDYNNDGDLDLFVANQYGENNFLYQNNGNGTFTKITNALL